MKIQCKECGVYFTIDQQDAVEHTGICDRCLDALPKKAIFQEEALVESKAQKKARQKAELEEARPLEEAKILEEAKLADEAFAKIPAGTQGVSTEAPIEGAIVGDQNSPVETISNPESPLE